MKLIADKLGGEFRQFNAYIYDGDGDAGNRLPFEVHAASSTDLDKRVALVLAMPEAYEVLKVLVGIFAVIKTHGPKAELDGPTFEELRKAAVDVLKKAGLR